MTAATTPVPAGCKGFDPWSPEFVANPYPAYARLRDEAPVTFCEATGQWLISRYDDVNALLRDRRLGRSYLHLATHEQMGQPADPPHLDPFWQHSGFVWGRNLVLLAALGAAFVAIAAALLRKGEPGR